MDARPELLDRSRYVLELDERFTDPELDEGRWIAHYLPHWTTPERSAARYDLGADGLRLRIEADQPAWRPEDGGLRVSNLQTGSASGALCSTRGQHRHRDGMQVRTPQPLRRLWTPTAGLVEAEIRAPADPTCLLAVWLVGLEDDAPEDSGEVCVVELFGDVIGPGGSRVRSGVEGHHDPRLTTDVVDLDLPLDATTWHTCAATWDAEVTRFFVDDELVRTVPQGTAYPLQLMVDLFEFPAADHRDPADYPRTAQVRSVRGYRPR